MTQRVKAFLTMGCVVVLTALVVVFAAAKVRHFRSGGEAGARVWFYDQNAKRLYPAPRDLIPPDGNNDNRVRAVVIGFQGMGNEISQLRVAYLEKYSPEFKALLEQGVIVRPMGSYLLPNFLRVSIGTEAENDRFLASLAKALKA